MSVAVTSIRDTGYEWFQAPDAMYMRFSRLCFWRGLLPTFRDNLQVPSSTVKQS